jgi:hypothetical protein
VLRVFRRQAQIAQSAPRFVPRRAPRTEETMKRLLVIVAAAPLLCALASCTFNKNEGDRPASGGERTYRETKEVDVNIYDR